MGRFGRGTGAASGSPAPVGPRIRPQAPGGLQRFRREPSRSRTVGRPGGRAHLFLRELHGPAPGKFAPHRGAERPSPGPGGPGSPVSRREGDGAAAGPPSDPRLQQAVLQGEPALRAGLRRPHRSGTVDHPQAGRGRSGLDRLPEARAPSAERPSHHGLRPGQSPAGKGPHRRGVPVGEGCRAGRHGGVRGCPSVFLPARGVFRVRPAGGRAGQRAGGDPRLSLPPPGRRRTEAGGRLPGSTPHAGAGREGRRCPGRCGPHPRTRPGERTG